MRCVDLGEHQGRVPSGLECLLPTGSPESFQWAFAAVLASWDGTLQQGCRGIFLSCPGVCWSRVDSVQPINTAIFFCAFYRRLWPLVGVHIRQTHPLALGVTWVGVGETALILPSDTRLQRDLLKSRAFPESPVAKTVLGRLTPLKCAHRSVWRLIAQKGLSALWWQTSDLSSVPDSKKAR